MVDLEKSGPAAEAARDEPPSGPVLAALQLSLTPGIGPRLYQQLVEAFGSPAAALDAPPAALREIPGIGTRLVAELVRARDNPEVPLELTRCRDAGIELLAVDDDRYPHRLREIYDPPAVLYRLGDAQPIDDLAIAIVGTRHPSPYGKLQAHRLARGVALAGLTVVSGLARGIDAEAHRGALAAGGRTLAVLGSGLLNLYPPDHGELAAEIVARGSLLSEFPTLQAPKAGAFPRRNRLISGLSLGVVVVEAAQRSGALITARHALEQGREVFAVPGRIDQRNSRGCHRLIRDGAKLIESVDDILEELGPLPTATRIDEQRVIAHPAELRLNERETAVLQAVQNEATGVDPVVGQTGLPVQQVLAALSALEMRRLVRRVSGTTWIRL